MVLPVSTLAQQLSIRRSVGIIQEQLAFTQAQVSTPE